MTTMTVWLAAVGVAAPPPRSSSVPSPCWPPPAVAGGGPRYRSDRCHGPQRAAGPRRASSRRSLATKYLLIAQAGNRRLERDFDPLEDRDRSSLVRARADLRDAAATERLFDRRLRQIRFPPATARVGRDLYAVNQARANLTAAAASSATLALLHSYDASLDAANGPVERLVGTIRRQLGLPPAPTS